MEPDKAKKPRRSHRDEYEVASDPKGLGRTVQRKMQQQMEASGSSSISIAAHGEDRSFESQPHEPTWPDRAG